MGSLIYQAQSMRKMMCGTASSSLAHKPHHLSLSFELVVHTPNWYVASTLTPEKQKVYYTMTSVVARSPRAMWRPSPVRGCAVTTKPLPVAHGLVLAFFVRLSNIGSIGGTYASPVILHPQVSASTTRCLNPSSLSSCSLIQLVPTLSLSYTKRCNLRFGRGVCPKLLYCIRKPTSIVGVACP